MISTQKFVSYLETNGFHFFTGVPCSYFKSVIRCIEEGRTSNYYIAPNEGVALALASGAGLAGKAACVWIQNSGLGNLINPLTSLNMIYRLPLLLFVSGRAYGIPDEPQHEIMGRTMEKLLDAIGIRHWDLPANEEEYAQVLSEGIQEAGERKIPVVFFVRKGTFDVFPPFAGRRDDKQHRYLMKRMDAIKAILEFIDQDDLVFSTTGKISRELFAAGDRAGNFYMQGSMGHIGSVALGTALSRPDRRVIVLDGDGAWLMHMGAVAMIGHYGPGQFYHIVLDNEAYETTGNQDTLSPTVDFEQIARAGGYRATAKAVNINELRAAMGRLLTESGPTLLQVKISRLETKSIPRITTRYSAPQITEAFQSFTVQVPAGLRHTPGHG